jgi:DNA-directed RNA polymerase delta subunit
MACDILKKARAPLHVSEILARIQSTFQVTVDRESLVSSLTKKVARGDRFLRTGKNTFALRAEAP